MIAKRKIRLEPTYTYEEVATSIGVSISLIQKESANGRLRATRLGRRMVITQRDLDDWWQQRHDRQADARATRVTRKDQRPVSPAKSKKAYRPQASDYILEGLGLPTK